MPSTYTLIKGETLASSAASYSFTAIPSTFTDLVLRVSLRDSTTATPYRRFNMSFNGQTTGYSQTYLDGNGAIASSGRYTGNSAIYAKSSVDTAIATASTFSSAEVYIPNYGGTTSKPLSIFGVAENNVTTAEMSLSAALSTLASAITSIAITPQSGNFVTGSSFYLYGIKNS